MPHWFEEEFTLDEEAIAFLEQATGKELDEFLGAPAAVSGTFTGTVQALTPGR